MLTRHLTSSAGDIKRFKKTFDDDGTPTSIEHLEWQYLRLPTRRSNVQVAVPDEDPDHGFAGINATFTSEFWVEDHPALAAQSLDTLTAAQYRGRGIFLRLARECYEWLRAEDCQFAYGMANRESVHGYSTKLGWDLLDPLPMLVRPLHSGYFLRRFGADWGARMAPRVPVLGVRPERLGLSVREFSAFGSEHEAVWQHLRSGIVAVNRTSRYLNWRLVDRPESRYRLLELRSPSGELVGWGAFVVRNRHGGRIGYVMELLTVDPGGAMERCLMRLMLRQMRDEGAEIVLAWNLPRSPNHRSFLRTGFMSFPERLRPIELHFAVLPLQPDTARVATDRDKWYLSYLDSDTV